MINRDDIKKQVYSRPLECIFLNVCNPLGMTTNPNIHFSIRRTIYYNVEDAIDKTVLNCKHPKQARWKM